MATPLLIAKSPLPSRSTLVDDGNSQPNPTPVLPSFIQSPVSRLAPDDLAFLTSKGALRIPGFETQNALIRAYLEHVHPHLPIINLEDFIESISEEGETQVSLLLFQGILFAGSAYVPFDLLRDAGFGTRQDARKAFYQRVQVRSCQVRLRYILTSYQLLYDFDCETDGVVIAQVLLLMTFWYEESDNHKNTWHWMDAAISQAFSQELHVDPMLSGSVSLSAQRLRRRVWWSCFMRDRLISLGMKRRSRIRDDDFNVAMLEPADFRSEYLDGRKPARTDFVCSYFHDENRRTTLARVCIAQVSLCRCLKPSMASQLTIRPGDISMLSAMDGMLPANGQFLAACHRDLLEWYDELYHGDKYQPISASDIHADGSANLELNRAVLHMIYYTGVLALHLSRVYDPGLPVSDIELSKVFVQHSAKCISEMTRNIEEHGLNRFLPTSAVGTTIAAIMVHLLELGGTLQANTLHAQENYHRCKRVMQSMKEIYFSTDLSSASTEFKILNAEFEEDTDLFWNRSNQDGSETWEDIFEIPRVDDQFRI